MAPNVAGFSVVGMPPPSSGGATIVGALRLLAGYALPYATLGDTLSQHRLVEACKHVFAMRMSLSDPAWDDEHTVDRVVADFVSGDFMEGLRKATSDTAPLPLSQYGGLWAQIADDHGYSQNASDAHEGDRKLRGAAARRPFPYLNDHGTSHFAIIDADGNAVSSK